MLVSLFQYPFLPTHQYLVSDTLEYGSTIVLLHFQIKHSNVHISMKISTWAALRCQEPGVNSCLSWPLAGNHERVVGRTPTSVNGVQWLAWLGGPEGLFQCCIFKLD